MAEESNQPAKSEPDRTRAQAQEPPRVYYLACGAQCDVFWWARRAKPAERAPAPISGAKPAS